MVGDTDAIIRYGGMYAIGLAYVGTSSNAAIRKLLHVAVSDVSDDVRRAAVTCIGFVLLRSPEQVWIDGANVMAGNWMFVYVRLLRVSTLRFAACC